MLETCSPKGLPHGRACHDCKLLCRYLTKETGKEAAVLETKLKARRCGLDTFVEEESEVPLSVSSPI
jgi:hypothetical protein